MTKARDPLVLFPLGLALGALAAGCTTGPATGQTFSSNMVGSTLTFEGYTDSPSSPITAQVLSNPDADPTVAGNYAGFGSGATGSQANNLNSTTLAYRFSFPSTTITSTQWRPGGLLRVKTRGSMNHGPITDLVTFDTNGLACTYNELAAGQSWTAAGYDCQSPYELANVITVASTSTTPEQLHGGNIAFLGMRGGAYPPATPTKPISGFGATGHYYIQIGAPKTYNDFRTTYGFTAGGETRAIYYNAGDLGIGRDMHCKSSTIGGAAVTACYVSNYGRVGSGPTASPGHFGQFPPQTAIAQAIAATTPPAISGTSSPVATVAMVYNAALPAGQRVSFMVYDQEGYISNFAALDNDGLSAIKDPTIPTHANINVPQNCLTCHGTSSTYTPSTVGPVPVTNAHFLAFDPDAYVYSTSDPTWSKDSTLPKLKALNALIMDTEPAPATTALLQGMYPAASNLGPKDAASVFDPTFVPPGWLSAGTAGKNIYNEVVKPYCRTCHVSHDPGVDWTSWQQFKDASPMIGFFACNNASVIPMPQAEQPQTRFWKSGARAHLVNAFTLSGACAP